MYGLRDLLGIKAGDAEFWKTLHADLKEHHNGWLPFSTWDAILANAIDANAVAVDKHGNIGTALGVVFFRRWQWLRESRAAGLNPAEAEDNFTASIERENERRRERAAERLAERSTLGAGVEL